jgi:hypothetical protein
MNRWMLQMYVAPVSTGSGDAHEPARTGPRIIAQRPQKGVRLVEH